MAGQLELSLRGQVRALNVTQLVRLVRETLEANLDQCWVVGEVSNARLAPSGHLYFTLKDPNSAISVVMFRSAAARLRFKVTDGMQVVMRGRVDLYETRGALQFYAEEMEPRGLGALQLAFEQLKERLGREGLFDQARKRALPFLPAAVGIVTALGGAGLRDIVTIMLARCPNMQIIIRPARVQGAGAAAEITQAIDDLNADARAEVLIVGRGGGSLEDLWSFNDEAVARAIVASRVPVVSAVGHETDVTIADFVADLRAPTPSAAAELVVPLRDEMLERLAVSRAKAAQALRYRLAMLERRLRQQGIDRALSVLHRRIGRSLQRVDEQEYRMRERLRAAIAGRERARRSLELRLGRFDIRPRLAADRHRMETADQAGMVAIRAHVARHRSAWQQLTAKLSQLSPLRILDRGYAIVSTEAGILKDAAAAPLGTGIHVRLAKGELDASVFSDREP